MDDAKVKDKVEDMKTKAKAFMKNFSSPFGSSRGASSSQTFKGQGHRLGGGAEPSGAPTHTGGGSGASSNGGACMARKLGPGFYEQKQQQNELRKMQQEKWERERGVTPPQSSCHVRETTSAHTRRAPAHVIQSGGSLSSAAASVKSPTPDDSLVERESRGTVQVGNLAPSYSSWSSSGHDRPANFDPYSPIIASGTSHRPAVAASRVAEPQGQFQCPICQKWWQSESQVSAHIDDCTGIPELGGLSIQEEESGGRNRRREQQDHITEDLDDAVAIFLSGGPSNATIEVILKIFRNILNSPSDEKLRKLRLGNSKIKETIGSAIGGLRFLESVGFRSVAEGHEYFSQMEKPSIEQQERIQAAIAYLDSYYSAKTAPVASSRTCPSTKNAPKTFDRQLRIFYASKDHLEERFELPDSFYKLSASEAKNEATLRRKKLEDSQMLIPKSFKDKQAALARKRYKVTVVRVQLPDGLVVQGFFSPGESTSSIYEFVASILKDSHESFDLVLPAAIRHRIIPRFPESSGQFLTLEDADLVPKALLKFNPTGPQGYTCLKSECYELCEPLTLTTLLEPGNFPKG